MAWTTGIDCVQTGKPHGRSTVSSSTCSIAEALSSASSTASGASESMVPVARTHTAQEEVVAETAHYMASFTAAARQQRLQAELASLHAQLREVAAVRLQRWFQRWYWRTHLLPQQLLRVNLLLYSCMTIQRAWRSVLTRRHSLKRDGQEQRQQQSTSSLSSDSSPLPRVSQAPRFTEDFAGLDIHASESAAESLTTSPERSPADMMYGSVWESHLLHEPRTSASTTADVPSARNQEDIVAAAGQRFILDVRLGMSLGDRGLRAAAVWRGYRVRRALACRTLQGKIQLRHDLYLLISDVESRGRLKPNGSLPQRLAPWVDVLYAGLARLQGEVLKEFTALQEGRVRMWGSARVSLIWRGWPRDLLRVPNSEKSERSSPQSFINESSLLASATYQACSPHIQEQEELDAETFDSTDMQRWRRAGSASPTRTSSPVLDQSPGSSSSAPSSPQGTQWRTPHHRRASQQAHVRPRVDCWATSTQQNRQVSFSSGSGCKAVCEAIREAVEHGRSRARLAADAVRCDEGMPRPGYMSDDNDECEDDDARIHVRSGPGEQHFPQENTSVASTSAFQHEANRSSPRWNRRLGGPRRVPAPKSRGSAAPDVRPSPRVRPGSLDSPEDVAAAVTALQRKVKQMGIAAAREDVLEGAHRGERRSS